MYELIRKILIRIHQITKNTIYFLHFIFEKKNDNSLPPSEFSPLDTDSISYSSNDTDSYTEFESEGFQAISFPTKKKNSFCFDDSEYFFMEKQS